MRTPESFEKQDIRNYLRQRNIWHFMPQGTGFGTNGIPDIIGCYKGRFIAIELKAGKGVASSAQLEFIRRVNEAGGIGFVAYDLDTVIEKLGLGDRFLLR